MSEALQLMLSSGNRVDILHWTDDDLALETAAEKSHLPARTLTTQELACFPDVTEHDHSRLLYLYIRNKILTLWHLSPTKELTFDKVVSHIRSPYNSDYRLILRIHAFLQRFGYINYGIFSHRAVAVERVAKRVVVIGAGAAGLAAARQLQYFGLEVIVLEARIRVGGRIRTYRREPDCFADLGAMFVMGLAGNPIATLAKQLDLNLHPVDANDCPLFDYDGNEVAKSRDRTVENIFNEIVSTVAYIAHKGPKRETLKEMEERLKKIRMREKEKKQAKKIVEEEEMKENVTEGCQEGKAKENVPQDCQGEETEGNATGGCQEEKMEESVLQECQEEEAEEHVSKGSQEEKTEEHVPQGCQEEKMKEHTTQECQEEKTEEHTTQECQEEKTEEHTTQECQEEKTEEEHTAQGCQEEKTVEHTTQGCQEEKTEEHTTQECKEGKSKEEGSKNGKEEGKKCNEEMAGNDKNGNNEKKESKEENETEKGSKKRKREKVMLKKESDDVQKEDAKKDDKTPKRKLSLGEAYDVVMLQLENRHQQKVYKYWQDYRKLLDKLKPARHATILAKKTAERLESLINNANERLKKASSEKETHIINSELAIHYREMRTVIEQHDKAAERVKEIRLALQELTKEEPPPVFMNEMDRCLLNFHFANLEYANGTSLYNSSMKDWNQDDDYECEGPHCIVRGGFDVITTALSTGLHIQLGTDVKQISYSNDGVRITCSTADGEFIHTADACLCTLPLGVLKYSIEGDESSPRFVPPLPDWKRDAIRSLGFGNLNKVILIFEKPFWGELQAFGHTSEQRGGRGEFYIFYPVCDTPVLIALMAGDAAHVNETLPSDIILNRAMKILSGIFGQSCPREPVDAIVTKWGSDIYARGCYSYISPNSSGETYDELARPVGDPPTHPTLFFAGEHTNRNYPSSVHGAFLSGLREAGRIADELIGCPYSPF